MPVRNDRRGFRWPALRQTADTRNDQVWGLGGFLPLLRSWFFR